MTQASTRLGCMIFLLITAAAAQAGPYDSEFIILRDVPARPAYRPETPSPNVTEVNTSPAADVVTALSSITPMNDAALSQGTAGSQAGIINQALSPLTGNPNQPGIGVGASTMGSAMSAGTSRIAPAITGAINGALMSGLGLGK